MIIQEMHIQKASKIALTSNIVKGKMSCLALSSKGTIITHSSNRLLRGNYIRFSEHCEEAVIRKLLRMHAFNRYRNITIFVFRISSRGVSMAKPCPKCQKLLNQYKVKVLFTDNNGQIKEL